MRKEKLQSNLNLRFPSGNIDISSLSREKLIELDIADEEVNIIDSNKLRLGSLGAYISFNNDSKDTISVTSSSIEIKSFDTSRLIIIFSRLKGLYSQIDILSGESVTNWHLIGEGVPEKILYKLPEPEGYKTDIIQLKKGRNILMLYQCGRNTVHVRHQTKLSSKSKFGELEINAAFKFDEEQTILLKFIDNISTDE